MTSSTWRRCSGLVSMTAPSAARTRGFLDGAQVVALIESDPDAPFAVAVTVAVDTEHRVAVLAPDREAIVPGPQLRDLADALATEFDALVVFEDIVAEGVGEIEEDGDDDPFAIHLDSEGERIAERAVVLTAASQRDLEGLATDAQTTLYALERDGGQVVFLEDGPALTALEWRAEHMPVVLLERGDSFPSVTVITEPGGVHMYSWDVTLSVVPDAAADVVHPFVATELGAAALVRQLVDTWTQADSAALHRAVEEPGSAGLPNLATALGLPDLAAQFLTGEIGAADVPDAVELDPMTYSEQVRRAMDDVADEARAQVEQMRLTADGYRTHARDQMREFSDDAREQARANMEQMRRQANQASEAMQHFADPDDHPTLAVTTPVAGLAQLVGAIFALRKALAHAQAGGTGTKWWGLLAGGLGTAAAANLALSALPWLRRVREERSAGSANPAT